MYFQPCAVHVCNIQAGILYVACPIVGDVEESCVAVLSDGLGSVVLY